MKTIASELPLMVTVSDGLSASRLCASKVHHVRWAVYTYAMRYIRYSSFIYATAVSALGQKQSRLFDYSPVDLPIGKMSWKTAPCACPGDADSVPP
jgi:hypothetical protein